MCTIRLLRADEIDVRAQQVRKEGAVLLLYKDARADMAILDETFGVFGWQRHHNFKDGNNYCTVSVWNKQTGHWVEKEDVGTESNTEKEKGQSSDAFKRACTNIGIGRELYTSPFIWVKLSEAEVAVKGDRCGLKPGVSFRVKEIEYDSKRSISKLVITDSKGGVRFEWSDKKAADTIPSDKKPFNSTFLSNKKYMDSLFKRLDEYEAEARVNGWQFRPYGILEKSYIISKEDINKILAQYEQYKQSCPAA